MSPVGFEPKISAGERPQTYALGLVHKFRVGLGAASGTAAKLIRPPLFLNLRWKQN
jgi:hypothetical protein